MRKTSCSVRCACDTHFFCKDNYTINETYHIVGTVEAHRQTCISHQTLTINVQHQLILLTL